MLRMRLWTIAAASGLCMVAAAPAAAPRHLDDAALRAYAGRPWSKAALMNRTVELGRLRGVPVVAEFPCADVCPQYTVRIIHYRLPADTSCSAVGGVERTVLVPVAITVLSRTMCIPAALVAGGQFESR
jgi:hypothetical protein